MSEIQKYDIIIVGAGAAGLSLASSIAQTEMLSHLQVLLLDKSEKKGNDRTWCFWESGDGESILLRIAVDWTKSTGRSSYIF